MSVKIKVKQIDGDVGNNMYLSALDDGVTSSVLGGAAAQTAQFWKTQTISQVLDAMLFPYQSPAMTFTVSGDSLLEVGQALPNTLTFTWSVSNPGNAVADSVTIRDMTNASDLFENRALDDNDTYTYQTAIVKTTATTHEWRARALNSNNQNVDRTVTKTWRWKKYWGSSGSTSVTGSLITSLGSDLATGNVSADTYTFAGGGYKYFAFPSTNPLPTIFKASNGFEVALAGSALGYTSTTPSGLSYRVVSVTNAYSQTLNYNVFRSAEELNAATTVIVT